MYPTEVLLERLRAHRRMGMEAVDFTGGEPTIHKDIVKLVDRASAMGYRDLGLITNGIALRRESLLDDLISAGIAIFNLSIHGHNAELHDMLTSRRGSFKTLMGLLRRLERRDASFGINMVVNVHNYRHLVDYAQMVAKFRARHGVTFLVMNPMNQAWQTFGKLTARHSEIAVYLKEAVAYLRKEGFPVSWKFMPLCIAPECIDESSNIQQFFLTPYDWNQRVTCILEKGRLEYYRVFFEHFSRYDRRQLSGVPFELLAYQTMITDVFGPFFEKVEQCKSCKYYYVCDGLSKEYRRLHGTAELRPIPGEKVVDPRKILGGRSRVSLRDLMANYGTSAIGRPLHRALARISRMTEAQ
jgi:MoaA/NifB/PqqE/SkfB family radical SAM enzyme